MGEPVLIGSISHSPLSVELFSSVEPSRTVRPCQDGISLSVTVFGDDPDTPLEGNQFRGSRLMGVVDGWLMGNGDKLGMTVDQSDGRVEWLDDEGDHQLVTKLLFVENEGSPTPTSPAEQLTELAIVVRFNKKQINDSDIAAALESKTTAELPEDITQSVKGIMTRVWVRLGSMLPGCFNKAWQKRVATEASISPLIVRSISRMLSATRNPDTADAWAALQGRLGKLNLEHEQTEDSLRCDDATSHSTRLERQLAPSMAATVVHLLSPDAVIKTSPGATKTTAVRKRRAHGKQNGGSAQPRRQEVVSGGGGGEEEEARPECAGEGWDEFDGDEDEVGEKENDEPELEWDDDEGDGGMWEKDDGEGDMMEGIVENGGWDGFDHFEPGQIGQADPVGEDRHDDRAIQDDFWDDTDSAGGQPSSVGEDEFNFEDDDVQSNGERPGIEQQTSQLLH